MGKVDNITEERDDTMTTKSKPVTGAFIVDASKTEKFLSTKVHTAKDAIDRIERRKKLIK